MENGFSKDSHDKGVTGGIAVRSDDILDSSSRSKDREEYKESGDSGDRA